jgi:hypothetical protein
MPAPRAPVRAAASPARDALRDAATLLLGHLVPEARRVLESRAPEAGAEALAAMDAGAHPMKIRALLLARMETC